MPDFFTRLESLIKTGDNATLDRLEARAEQFRKLIADEKARRNPRDVRAGLQTWMNHAPRRRRSHGQKRPTFANSRSLRWPF